MDSGTNWMADTLKVEKAWAAVRRSLNLDVLSSILSTKYRQIQPDGTVIGKDEILDSDRSGNRRWEVAESDKCEIRIFGDVAHLIGRWQGIGENKGEKFNYAARFLAVCRREGNDWKLVSDVSVPLEG